ncbi:FAD-dependent oxidoreductase domain-containing protein 1 isoform X3 [Melopsittacus undulatus]|uniref:FAD-dependent oxidoreductase domain-containing protein 1 isoform X3 n=1 Tax=Melopsittacus undulatus TaxID=13146 RepID=UPI00146C2E36|nr:FAD-dependent oxidoreductase domain-containing protein 1 isoform X3 [Melopsittacus undulatus]
MLRAVAEGGSGGCRGCRGHWGAPHPSAPPYPSELGLRLRLMGRTLQDQLSPLAPGTGSWGPPGVPRDPQPPEEADVVVVGGGVVGWSVAYWLKALEARRHGMRVLVLERDPTYSRASTVLSAGGIRQQFSLPENIHMSRFSASFLRNINEYLGVPNEPPVDIQFQPSGYLFLASPQDAEGLEATVKVQRSGGRGLVRPLDPPHCSAAQSHVPGGAQLRRGGFVTSAEDLMPPRGPDPLSARIKRIHVYMQDSLEYQPVTCAIVVNAAGAWAGELLETAGLPEALRQPLPIQPRKRYIFSWHCHDGPGLSCPFLIDTTGAYFRREGIAGNYLGGMSPPEEEEPDPSDLSVDHSYFQEQVWPRLARRVPAFSSLRPGSSWAGYYDHNSFDRNGVVGAHPRLSNLLVAAGFSGHGLQHAPAAGRALAELVLKGRYETLDLSRLGWSRLVQREPLVEGGVV